MNKKNDTKLSMRFYIDCEMNVELNKINEASKRLSLLKHWALNFEKMHPMYKNDVIRTINEEANAKEFYDIFAPIEEVEE